MLLLMKLTLPPPRKEFVDDITDTLEDTQNEERNLKRKRDDEEAREKDRRVRRLGS